MSGFSLNVKADIREVEKMLSTAQRKVLPKAAARSINRTAQKVRTTARREVARQMGVKQKQVKKQIEIVVKAGRTRLLAVVEAKGGHLNLIEFVVPSKRKQGAFRKKKGVTAKAYGKRKEYPGTFITHGKNSSKLLVMTRKTKKRKPVRGVYGPSIPKTFIQKKITDALQREAAAQWGKEFEHNVNYYLQRAGYPVK